MAQVGFYHLTRSGLLQALPQLLERTLAAGQRALVLCPTEDAVRMLDTALWDTPDLVWLPHGTAADGDADLQPIWLASDDAAPNAARFLFLVQGMASDRLDAFDRVFDLFDGNDEASVAAARERWKKARAGGHDLIYWQQGPRGWTRA
jgi:DNA polymerase-3 subunit chi